MLELIVLAGETFDNFSVLQSQEVAAKNAVAFAKQINTVELGWLM